MTFAEFLADAHPELDAARAESALALVAEGFAPVFVARRLAARTGGVGDDELAAILDAKERFDALRERQRFVAEEIERQGLLTPELRATVDATVDRERLDDLYLPYKRRRRTPGAAALDAGLGPLADWIWNCGHGLDTPLPGQTLDLWAFTFRSEEHGIADAAQAIAGAEDVLVERLVEQGGVRARLRELAARDGWLEAARGERAKEGSRFAGCFDLLRPVAWFRTPEGAARYLAVRRGVNEGELRARITGGPDDPGFLDRLRAVVGGEACTVPESPGAAVLARAAARAFDEQLWPAVEVSVQKALRAAADDVALAEIAAEVRRLLLAPPLGRRPVLGLDPVLRGTRKVAVADASGRPVAHAAVQLDGVEKRARAGEAMAELVAKHGVEAVAVAEGVAGKETLRAVRSALRERGVLVPVLQVSDAGLAAWATSDAARDEHPDLDPATRAALSVARRLQDPLAELAKGEPRTLAAGPWVHDVSVPRLEKTLAAVVARAVADVGVDANLAADVLLARLPGVTPGLAHAIVEHRAAHGAFTSRAELRAVPLMDARAYEQMEPFLRLGPDDAAVPDPRGRLEPVTFHPEVRTLADLEPGLVCPGVVTNVTGFGAFVDVGLPHDGLVHVSRLADQFVSDPHAVVRVGDRVEVRVIEVNREKQQIALSMKREPPARPAAGRATEPRRRPEPARDRDRDRPGRGRPEKPAFNNPFAALAADLKRGTPTDRSK